MLLSIKDYSNRSEYIKISFLFSVFFLFLLLSERILFKDLPQFPILRYIDKKCLITEANILLSSVGSLMKLAKFRYHDCTTNLKIAQGLLISIKHKEAAAEVIK